MLMMLQIGIVRVLEIQGEKAFRARREVNVRLRMQIVFHVINVQVIIVIVIAGELNLLLLIVLVLFVGDDHRMNGVCERRWPE